MIQTLSNLDYWWGFGSCFLLILLLSYMSVAWSSEKFNVRTRKFLLNVQLKKRKQFETQLKKKSDESCKGK